MSEKFCENLKKNRLENGYSQKDFAEKLGVAKSTYCMYENGYREPNVNIIKRIANLLDVSVDDLFGIDDSPAVSKAEFSDLVQKYRALDADGKETVDFILDKEYQRSVAEKKKADNIVSMTVNESSDYELNAAHADDYENAPDDLKKQEEDIMDDENF